jgi:hypothetical protein
MGLRVCIHFPGDNADLCTYRVIMSQSERVYYDVLRVVQLTPGHQLTALDPGRWGWTQSDQLHQGEIA